MAVDTEGDAAAAVHDVSERPQLRPWFGDLSSQVTKALRPLCPEVHAAGRRPARQYRSRCGHVREAALEGSNPGTATTGHHHAWGILPCDRGLQTCVPALVWVSMARPLHQLP
eukprot:CAMPEP_0172741626 /NCGR_PEP_ID=MMETSP1074-20121228/127659_1 /TAXON_ID=2916 /ORGANISM="Ceratium fusus, Strain PA161109" /LENGTH=112 /DNA_ID=CAMNT_0013571987 /DNA_START=450 /DNA_END=789 /DNA_ORIENTATION=+